jgi:hypothetical protein
LNFVGFKGLRKNQKKNVSGVQYILLQFANARLAAEAYQEINTRTNLLAYYTSDKPTVYNNDRSAIPEYPITPKTVVTRRIIPGVSAPPGPLDVTKKPIVELQNSQNRNDHVEPASLITQKLGSKTSPITKEEANTSTSTPTTSTPANANQFADAPPAASTPKKDSDSQRFTQAPSQKPHLPPSPSEARQKTLEVARPALTTTFSSSSRSSVARVLVLKIKTKTPPPVANVIKAFESLKGYENGTPAPANKVKLNTFADRNNHGFVFCAKFTGTKEAQDAVETLKCFSKLLMGASGGGDGGGADSEVEAQVVGTDDLEADLLARLGL